MTGASAISIAGAPAAEAETSDALAAATYVPKAEKGQAFGVATLDDHAKVPSAQLPDLSATYEVKENAAVGLLFAGLASSSVTACNIVFTGSSTTAGNNATAESRRYVNILTAAIQAAFPAPGGTEAGVVVHTEALWGTPSAAPGVHSYNGAQGGTSSETYMSDTEAERIMSLSPAMVLHMIGSNDYASNLPPTTYKAAVLGRVSKLAALSEKPFVQILVHSYHRFDVTGTYLWSDYGDALRDIAATSENIMFVDLSGFYTAANIPGDDPYGLIDTDLVHQTDSGHRMMADLLTRALRIPPAKMATSAAVPMAVPTVVNSRITSDTFSGPDEADIGGRAADAMLGGATRTWAKDGANQVAVVANAIARGAGPLSNFSVNIPEQTMNMEISFTLTSVPVGDNLLVDIHRQRPTVAGSPDTYRMVVGIGGALSIARRLSGAQTTLATGATAAAQDRVAFRCYKGSLEVRKNGVLVLVATDTAIQTIGHVGISGTTALRTFGLDDLAVDAVT
ncbi:hypothetical protein TV39_16145 [Arthrobacter sp. SPG23]|nr:hypothetical protein TV39_16145 [Arthrobacter sp. SPG23]